jgi:Mce-associated membrane protein
MAIDVGSANGAVNQSDGVDQADKSAAVELPNPDVTDGDETEEGVDQIAAQHRSGVRLALVFGMAILVALGSMTGWLGWRAYQSHAAQQQRNVLLQAGRQAALNLTTIGYTQAEADAGRVVDGSIGAFRADFQQRAPDFISVVKRAQSTSKGTISEAALESQQGDQGQVLVAVSVQTVTPADKNPAPRGWRMRISVQQTPDGPKVSNVEFVP